MFNLYKRLWDKGRIFRAERDLMRLPLPVDLKKPGQSMETSEEFKILYSRRPSNWPGLEGNKNYCYRIPEAQLEMSDLYLEGDSISYPDDPEVLAVFCQKRATFYEGLSGILLVGGIVMNFFLIWIISNGLF